MKKAKSRKGSSGRNRKAVPKNVDEYLARVPEPARSTLNRIRAVIRSAVPPAATETISYRIPAFRYKEVLVWFAAFSDHCRLFPTASIIEAFKKELEGFYTAKGTIHFPTNKPLPAALIKKLGFASRITRKEQYAFVFRKEKQAWEANIKDIAKQRYFHAHPAESNLEHLISIKESVHAKLIARLRVDDIFPGDKALIDEFVIHLGLRTRNLRDGFAAVGNTMFDALEHKFSGNAEADKRLDDALMQALRNQVTSPPLRDFLVLLPVELRKTFLMMAIAMTKSSLVRSGFVSYIQEFRSKVDFSAVVEKTHLKALSGAQLEGAIRNRREHFAGLDWKLIRQPVGTFILGDVGPFAKYRDSAEYTHVVKVEGVLDSAAVPISSSRLLVGHRPGFCSDLSPDAVNTISAELSRDFYVASQNTQSERQYLLALGKRKAFMTEEEFFNLGTSGSSR